MPEDNLLAKELVKAWSRYTIALGSVEQSVLNELKDEGVARQFAQWLFQKDLSTDLKRREVALRMALVEFQLRLEHA